MDEQVEIDISDENFMKLAKMAHEQNITLNQLCVNLLQEYVDGKIELPQTVKEETSVELRVIRAVSDIIIHGPTQNTLIEYGQAFTQWNLEYTGDESIRTMIEEGLHVADLHE